METKPKFKAGDTAIANTSGFSYLTKDKGYCVWNSSNKNSEYIDIKDDCGIIRSIHECYFSFKPQQDPKERWVVCKDTSNTWSFITLHEKYRVLDEGKDTYLIKNNAQQKEWFEKYRFELLNEPEKEVIQPQTPTTMTELTAMEQAELRLSCLREAKKYGGDQRTTVKIAGEYYSFVTAQAEIATDGTHVFSKQISEFLNSLRTDKPAEDKPGKLGDDKPFGISWLDRVKKHLKKQTEDDDRRLIFDELNNAFAMFAEFYEQEKIKGEFDTMQKYHDKYYKLTFNLIP